MSDSVSDSVGPAEAGAWLPLEEAARVLGVTVRTIDRRKLPKRRLAGRPAEVWVAGASDDVSETSETDVGQESAPDERVVSLSERVSDVVGRQMVPILAELRESRLAIERLASENGALRERVAMLEAAQSPGAAQQTPAAPAPTQNMP
jgi:hypothetical protein